MISREAAQKALEKIPKPDDGPKKNSGNGQALDVMPYLQKYGIDVVKTKEHKGNTLYCLESCVFDSSHNGNESAIGQTPEGKLFYQCFHDSCSGRGWKDARAIISGSDRIGDPPADRETTPEPPPGPPAVSADGGHAAPMRGGLQDPKQKPERPKGITAAQLQNTDFPEAKWAVPGILPEGLSILGGKPKMGKSIMALNIALAVSHGGRALGSIDVEPGVVLYFALEDTPRRLKNRIGTMLPSGGRWPDRLVCFTDWPKMGAGGIKAIQDEIGDHEAVRLIIIDTLKMFRPQEKRNRNQYDVDYEPVTRIKKEIADRHGVAALLIHHMNKGGADDIMDSFNGSFGLTGAADGLIALARKTGQADAVLHGSGRDFEPFELALQFRGDHLTWDLMGEASEVKTTQNQQLVYDCIKNAVGPVSPKYIADQTGLKADYIRQKALPILQKDGSIKKSGYGRYIKVDTPDILDTVDTPDTVDTLAENQGDRVSAPGQVYPNGLEVDTLSSDCKNGALQESVSTVSGVSKESGDTFADAERVSPKVYPDTLAKDTLAGTEPMAADEDADMEGWEL